MQTMKDTLAKMTTDELIDILNGGGGPEYDSQHALDCVMDLLAKRITKVELRKMKGTVSDDFLEAICDWVFPD